MKKRLSSFFYISLFPQRKKSKSLYFLVTTAIAVFITILAVSTKHAYHSTIFSQLHYRETFYSKPTSKPKFIITLMGAPGSGKGALAQNCRLHFKFETFNLGKVFRRHIAKKTTLGRTVEPYINSGKLAPDKLSIEAVTLWLKEKASQSRSVILDGYPRTAKQANSLASLLKEQDFSSYKLINILMIAPKKEILKRLRNRFICSNKACQATFVTKYNPPRINGICDFCHNKLTRRADDRRRTLEKRFVKYWRTEKEVISSFEQANRPTNIIKISKDSFDVYVKKNFEDFKQILNGHLNPVHPELHILSKKVKHPQKTD